MYNSPMSRLVLSFLGTFQVTLDRQPITHFRSANNQGLLVYLALQSERALPREVLIALFWPEAPDAQARNNLRQSLYQLRRLLGDLAESERPYLLVTRQTVQFNPQSDYELDVQQFLAAVEAGDLETAVSTYHGDLLPGFTCDSLEFEDWLRQERESLNQTAVSAMYDLAQAYLGNNQLDKAQETARQQLSLEPWREQAHRQLMQALALAGERVKALAQYEQCRERLWEELGIEPEAETVALYEAIKAGEFAQVVKRPPRQMPQPNLSNNLPAGTTPFIGREAELAALAGFMADSMVRLITILGPGGMGKTRLALAMAEQVLATGQFADGVFFVDLAPLSEPQQIGPAIVEALGIQLGGAEAGSSRQQLLDYLADKKMVFILDNFEHLLAGANLAAEIITAAPEVRLLVTSRERLHLLQEQLFPIPGLEFPDLETAGHLEKEEFANQYTAVQLFLGAARRVRPDFQLAAKDLSCLTRICNLVDGMPLALELAAGWVELLPLSEIADEIERSLGFLETDLRDVPDRQRSIRVVFEATWNRLETAEREMMQKLAVFRGSFTREAAHRVAANQLPAARLLRLLSGLVSKSLLQANTDRQRYRIHELVRQFARERLEQSGEVADTRTAHSNYYLNLLQEREGDIKGGREQKQALDEIELDFANVRAAWVWALEQGNLAAIDRSLESLFWYFWFHSRQIDGMSLFERSLEQLPDSSTGDIHRLQRRLAVRRLYLDRGANLLDPAEKLREMEKILAETEEVGTKEEIAFAYHTLGHAQIDFGGPDEFDFPAIIDNFTKSLALYREMNESFYESQVLDWLSVVYFTAGDPNERVRIAKERLAMAEKRGDRLTIADTLAQIGVGAELAGRYDEAEEKYRQALPVFQEYGDKWHHTEYLLRLAGLALLKGDFEEAKRLTEEGRATVKRYNLLSVEPHIVEHLAMVLCAEEAYEQAIEISVMPRLHFYQPTVFALDRGLMFGYCGLGNFTAAREHLRGALKTATLMKAAGWLVQCLVGAALIAAGEGRLEWAAELLGLAFHHPAGASGWLEKFPLIIRLREQLAAAMGTEAYSAAWEKGKEMDLETAVNQVRTALQSGEVDIS